MNIPSERKLIELQRAASKDLENGHLLIGACDFLVYYLNEIEKLQKENALLKDENVFLKASIESLK